jgi:5-methylcytosine-specific restriction enzyme A
MLAIKDKMIAKKIANGTGAEIAVRALSFGRRKGLCIWFNDLGGEKYGPIAEIKPHGLKSHDVRIYFGSFSAPTIYKITRASTEAIQLARLLVKSIVSSSNLDIKGQNIDNWLITDGSFEINARYTHKQSLPNDDAAINETCDELIIPFMAALAELIGYEVVDIQSEIPAIDGAISIATISRRERNRRNRLLCLRIHGEICKGCNLLPKNIYNTAGNIIEVHHLEPVSMLKTPRAYNPETDLIPLCPNCHRAVHTRSPWPLSLQELNELMSAKDD